MIHRDRAEPAQDIRPAKEASMTSGWDEPKEDEEVEQDDPGFLGGGGVAETAEGNDDDELDEHGDNLATADEDEL